MLFFLLKPIFWGLHCFACTVFRLLQAASIQPPIFDFTSFSKKNVCRPVFQQAAVSLSLNVRRKIKVESNIELIPTINIYSADKLMPLQPLIF